VEEDTNISIFKEISEKCSQKIIRMYSNKLEKKISFKSSKDIENLRDLTFALYVYNYIDFVEIIIQMTHDCFQNINPKDGFVKDLIFAMWGLEIRLLREKNEIEKIKKIIEEIDNWLKRPPRTEKMEKGRREKIILWEADGKIDITRSEMLKEWVEKGKTNEANKVRLLALSQLIGHTETGLYPILNENKEKIESIINEYKEEIIKNSK